MYIYMKFQKLFQNACGQARIIIFKSTYNKIWIVIWTILSILSALTSHGEVKTSRLFITISVYQCSHLIYFQNKLFSYWK